MDAFGGAFGPCGLPPINTCVFPTYGLAEHTVFVCSGGLPAEDTEIGGFSGTWVYRKQFSQPSLTTVSIPTGQANSASV